MKRYFCYFEFNLPDGQKNFKGIFIDMDLAKVYTSAPATLNYVISRCSDFVEAVYFFIPSTISIITFNPIN